MTAARYAVGIDLGTTNSAVAFVDLLAPGSKSVVFQIDQEVSAGLRSSLPVLPSAVLLFNDDRTFSVGKNALDSAGRTPDQVILSAKSWLAHGGIDREAAILPWQSKTIPSENRLSPVTASAAILSHIRAAWDKVIAEFEPQYTLQNQVVVITVPASFDEAAQRLTIKAATQAGFGSSLRLLEEPQAAFYRWLELNEDVQKRSETILVVDVGGGTTDFSLFDVTWTGGTPLIVRRSVSEHILLGGDNIDRAIAHSIEASLTKTGSEKLSPFQHAVLVQQARALKERVLSQELPTDETFKVSFPSLSASLFDAPLVAEISSNRIFELVLEGFYPIVSNDDKPERTQSGLREIGLPYARDSRILVHLASFVRGENVDAVLFNGGSLAAPIIRNRILDCIAAWQNGKRPRVLENSEYDLAVARGAASFGASIALGTSAAISGGHPRSLYIEVFRKKSSEPRRGICVVPKGFLSESIVTVPGENFSLLTGTLARFQLWHSGTRPDDKMGDIVVIDDLEFHELSPISTRLDIPNTRPKPPGGTISVKPAVRLTQTGLLELTFEEVRTGNVEPLSFKLEFSLRKDQSESLQPEIGEQEGVDKAILQRAIERIDLYFGKGRTELDQGNPKQLPRDLEQVLKSQRADWTLPILRGLWPAISRGVGRRGRSSKHEEIWCLLAGWLLRPGYGYPGDESRIREAWKAWEMGLAFPKDAANRMQWWIFWRRIAAGLSSDEQTEIFRRATTAKSAAPAGERSEINRLFGALERVPVLLKEEAAESLVREACSSGSNDASIPWAIGRLAARIPFYAGIDAVIPPSNVERWISRLLESQTLLSSFKRALLLMARSTSERSLNVNSDIIALLTKKLRPLNLSNEELSSLTTPAEFVEDEIRFWSGDQLPSGIRVG